MTTLGKTLVNYERLAMILVEAFFLGDKPAAKKWGITDRTIINYRTRMSTSPELSVIFLEKKAIYEQEWAAQIPEAVIQCLNFIGRAAREGDPKNPEMVHAIAGAMKLASEIGLAKDVIDARLGRFNIPARTENNEVGTTIEYSSDTT